MDKLAEGGLNSIGNTMTVRKKIFRYTGNGCRNSGPWLFRSRMSVLLNLRRQTCVRWPNQEAVIFKSRFTAALRAEKQRKLESNFRRLALGGPKQRKLAPTWCDLQRRFLLHFDMQLLSRLNFAMKIASIN